MRSNELVYRLKQGEVEERDGEIYVNGEQVVPIDETTEYSGPNFDDRKDGDQKGDIGEVNEYDASE